jgi:hypothetical protein
MMALSRLRERGGVRDCNPGSVVSRCGVSSPHPPPLPQAGEGHCLRGVQLKGDKA